MGKSLVYASLRKRSLPTSKGLRWQSVKVIKKQILDQTKNMHLSNSKFRLCIYCRELEPVNQPCPQLLVRSERTPRTLNSTASARRSTSGLSETDQRLIERLQEESSSMCQRCAEYDVIGAFQHARPLDENQRAQLSKAEFMDYHHHMDTYRLKLGIPSLILLTPTCPLCRLLYCILPVAIDEYEEEIHIEPYRSYIRDAGWEIIPEHLKNQCAIFLGLAAASSLLAPVADPFKPGDGNIRMSNMPGPAIALQAHGSESGTNLLNGIPIRSTLDLALLKKPLDYCLQHHDNYCRVPMSQKLQVTKMIDVERRTVVPCPTVCDYIALSYVWGGVQPTPGALEKRCLPETIEDAIEVTKALGRRYLWVCYNEHAIVMAVA